MMDRSSTKRRMLALAILPALLPVLAMPAMLHAAEKPERAEKKERPQPRAVLDFAANEKTRLEAEIAGLIQQRAALSATTAGWMDLRIDARVLSLWASAQLINVDPHSDAQAVAWLRYADTLSLSATLDAANLTAAPTPAQGAALAKIHKATFDFKDAGSVADLDAALTPLREPLLTALAAGKAVDVRPTMPTSTPRATGKETADPDTAPLALDQMSPRVTQLSISPGLRQQLLAAIASAKQAGPDDADKITAALRDAIALAGVLQTNFAVDPDARSAMEKQLGEAIALFSDSRVREAGQQRLAGLRQYRTIATRVTAMKLPPDVVRSFAPALGYVRDHAESADTVLSTMDRFAAIDAQMATKKSAPAADAASRAAEQQLKKFADERSGLLSEAESMGGGGAFNFTPDNLADHVTKLQKIAQLYDLLKNLPQTQAQLLQLRPKPTGGLEKRLTQAIVHSNAADDAQQAEAAETLGRVAEFASAWQAVLTDLQQPIADEPMHVYTGKTWNEAAGALRQIAADVAGQIASNAQIDAGKIAALARVPNVLRGVRQAAAFQQRLGDPKSLSRWADCNLDSAKLTAALDAYQSEFSAAAAATLGGGGDDKSLARVQNKYRGLLATLDVIAAVAPACDKIPADLPALISRLTIASDKTPREATVRALCWTSDLVALMQAAPDSDAAETAKLRERLLQTLNRANPAAPTAR